MKRNRDSSEDSKLRDMLSNWKVDVAPNSEFSKRVHERIHDHYLRDMNYSSVQGSFAEWLSALLFRPVFYSAILAIIILLSLGLLLSLDQTESESEHWGQEPSINYRRFVRPADFVKFQIQAKNGFENLDTRGDFSKEYLQHTLNWVGHQINLDPRQRNRFELLHTQNFGQFASLYHELIRLENQYRAFERHRIQQSEVDMLSVFENLKAQKDIYQRAMQLQTEFINDVLGILNQEQRVKFAEIISNPTPETLPSAWMMAPKSEWKI